MIRWLRFLPRLWWSPRAWRSWIAYSRWRLETYGVYYPDNRWNQATFRQLLRQIPSYTHWLRQIDLLRRKAL